jgi:hypothetical protein
MASIRREIMVEISPDTVWSAVRDVGAVDSKLVPGIVTRVSYDGGLRHVVFSNGLEIDELIVSIDDTAMRVVYAVQGRAKHHQASMQVIAHGPGQTRFIWITDVLPDDAASRFANLMDQALPVIKRTLESNAHHT